MASAKKEAKKRKKEIARQKAANSAKSQGNRRGVTVIGVGKSRKATGSGKTKDKAVKALQRHQNRYRGW